MKRIPLIANVISETSLDRPELRIQPRARSRGAARRLDRRACRKPSASPPSATSARRSPNSTPATGWCRSACSSKTARAATIRCSSRLRVPIGGGRGGVPLSVVADIKLDQGPTSINRYDRERQATVAADLVGTAALGDAMKLIYDLPVMKSLPKGVQRQPVRRRRKPQRTVRRLRHRDQRRPDDGLCGAGAAVRHLPAADHHPVLAAAVDRRRDRGAARSPASSSRRRCGSAS